MLKDGLLRINSVCSKVLRYGMHFELKFDKGVSSCFGNYSQCIAISMAFV